MAELDVIRMDVRIRRLTSGDEEAVMAAVVLFDEPPVREAVAAYLADPGCFLLIAYLDDEPAGFVRGQLLRHLETASPELFLYEIGVDEAYRRKGVARALIEEFKAVAREEQSSNVFVLTNASNVAAMGLYETTGGVRDNPDDVMFTYVSTA